jgi:hypothetical protein
MNEKTHYTYYTYTVALTDGSPRVVVVDEIAFRACPEQGAWYELDDPNPNGSVGRLYMPMLRDGAPDIEQLGEIEVAYEEA